MTRINLVEPEQLSNVHLKQEFEQIPSVFELTSSVVESSEQLEQMDLPDMYKFGKGHVKFFYDKLGWLLNRYAKLRKELLRRDMYLDEVRYGKVFLMAYSLCESLEWGYFDPMPEEMYLSMGKLVEINS